MNKFRRMLPNVAALIAIGLGGLEASPLAAAADQAARFCTSRDIACAPGQNHAVRVAGDVLNAPPRGPVVHYAVPAMSGVQRLPDAYPADGAPGAAVAIVAARGEYEPGSFLVCALDDLGKCDFSVGPLKSKDGAEFPTADLDLRLVKVWYQNRARQGNLAWNGTESIHGRSTWGRLVFDLPASPRTAILRHRIFTVLAGYKAEKATRAEHAGILDFWQDPVLGDPEFYQVRVKPLVEKLDAFVPLVKPGMSDEDVARVAAGALQGWADIRYTVDVLRRQWLRERLSYEPHVPPK